MPFGVVRGVGRGMGVLDGDGDRRREGTVLGVNLGRPIVANGAFPTLSSQIQPKYGRKFISELIADLVIGKAVCSMHRFVGLSVCFHSIF